MGIVPLITTVSSYMIIPRKLERQHLADFSYFIHDKDEDVYKARTIRNCCLDLISSLIEVFGDLAVESILFVIENILFLSAQSQELKAKSPQKMTLTKTVEEINIYRLPTVPSERHLEGSHSVVCGFLVRDSSTRL